MRGSGLAAGFGVLLLASGAAAAESWSANAAGADVEARLERRGARGSLVVEVRPRQGVRIEPPVVRIDVPALMRRHFAGRFPTTARAEPGRRGGAIRAILPLKRAGTVGFGDTDRHGGALRIEYRACTGESPRCSVEQVDVPLREGG